MTFNEIEQVLKTDANLFAQVCYSAKKKGIVIQFKRIKDGPLPIHEDVSEKEVKQILEDSSTYWSGNERL